MKNIRKIILAAMFTLAGTAAAFADLISPGPSGNSSGDPQVVSAPATDATASQGGVIILVMLIVAAVIVLLISLLTSRGRKEADAPAAAAAPSAIPAAAMTLGAARLEDSAQNEGLHEENQADAEIMQSDAEIAQSAPEEMAVAAEANAVDTGSAGLGGEVGGDLG